MARDFVYPATLESNGEGGFLVKFPDLPDAFTEGDTIDEALDMAADLLAEAISARIDDQEDIPQPSARVKGQYLIDVPVQTAAKAALYLAMRESGLTKVALAQRLGWDEKEVRRLLNPRHRSKVPRIAEALSALGHRLSLRLTKDRKAA